MKILLAPDVISSSLTSARHHQPITSEMFKNRKGRNQDFIDKKRNIIFFKETDRLHQSTDSLADTSSKGSNQISTRKNSNNFF
jgi:hypothetical protein